MSRGGYWLEQLDVLLVDQAGVGEDGDEQALALEQQVDVGEVGAQERLAAGDQAPQRAQLDGLGGDGVDLGQGQLAGAGLGVAGGQVDVAVAAVVVAAGGQLDVEGEGHALGGLPEGEVGEGGVGEGHG